MSNLPLVIYNKQLGDVLLLEPALSKLASINGGVMLATRPAFAPMIQLMDRVSIVSTGWFREASQVISFDPRSRACVLSMTTWASEKRLMVSNKKYIKPWHSLFFPTQRVIADDSESYRAEYFFNLVSQCSAMGFRPPILKIPPVEWRPDALPENYVLLHLTSAWRRKSWLSERWAVTLLELARQGWGPFVITGGDSEWEREYIDDVVKKTGLDIVNLCGRTSLKQYLSVISNASVLLCVDGSSSHIASAFGVPAVTLFVRSNPLHWHYPTSRSKAIDVRAFCLNGNPDPSCIPVDSVVAASIELMNNQMSGVV